MALALSSERTAQDLRDTAPSAGTRTGVTRAPAATPAIRRLARTPGSSERVEWACDTAGLNDDHIGGAAEGSDVEHCRGEPSDPGAMHALRTRCARHYYAAAALTHGLVIGYVLRSSRAERQAPEPEGVLRWSSRNLDQA
ncbi:hypothetical protein GCM10018952_28080 [Streptosporangium vulgare]